MGVYLTREEVDFYSEALSAEFERLTRHRWFAARKSARQWAFFRHSFEVLVGRASGDFDCGRQEAVQYKYEISDKLRRYYSAPGEHVRFIFTLESEKQSGHLDGDDAAYPRANGYLLRVTLNEPLADSAQQISAYLKRVVADAIDAEWAVYTKLPRVDLTPLDGLFDPNGSAYKRIQRIAQSHSKKQFTLANDLNPSTRRLIDVRVVELTTAAARVRTSEYWLLYWWSLEDKAYIKYVYNELNKQTYFLALIDNRWLVQDNYYPTPKTSTPRRSF